MANLRTNNLCGRGFVSVNDGTIWSSLFDGSTLGSYPVTNAFDGDVSTFMYPAAGTSITWTAPNGGIKSGRIEVYVYAGNTHPIVTVNGVSTGAVVGSDYGQQGNWVDVTSLVGGNLKTITCFGETIGGVARQSGFSAVRINGEILVDGEYGTTGGRRAYRGSVFFDGTGDKLSVPNSADVRLGSNDFTVEAWVKFGNVEGDWDTIIGMWDHTQTRRTFNFQRYNTNGQLYLYVSTDGGSTNWAYANGGNLTVNHWHHVAGVRDGNTLRVYQNGVQVGTASYSDSILNNTTDALFIGDVQTSDTNNFSGYISNVRLINGTCIYPNGTTFTPPQHESTLVPNTVLLACQNSDDPTQEATGKTITAAGGQLVNAAYVRQQPKVIPPYGVDAGNTFGGPIQQSSQGYMYFPTGRTEERGRGRGIFACGYIAPARDNTIDFINIQSMGNATMFGDLTEAKSQSAPAASSTRGTFSGGIIGSTNVIEFITIATTADAVNFGDLSVNRVSPGGLSNQTRAVVAGGTTPAATNVIEFFTIASTGDSTDFGDAANVVNGKTGAASPTRGIFAGGYAPDRRQIEFITIASAGNATDFGECVEDRGMPAGGSNATRALFAGGESPAGHRASIDTLLIATTGNATDFGDLQRTITEANGGASNEIRICFAGGNNPSQSPQNVIDVVNIVTTGAGADFGDLTLARRGTTGLSDSHGGLS